MLKTLGKLWRDDRGQDLAEYALMLTLVLLVVATAITTLGTNTSNIFQQVADRLK